MDKNTSKLGLLHMFQLKIWGQKKKNLGSILLHFNSSQVISPQKIIRRIKHFEEVGISLSLTQIKDISTKHFTSSTNFNKPKTKGTTTEEGNHQKKVGQQAEKHQSIPRFSMQNAEINKNQAWKEHQNLRKQTGNKLETKRNQRRRGMLPVGSLRVRD
ncbi:hypothetical protein SLE2022_147590 [Rubroshorea leprosula]